MTECQQNIIDGIEAVRLAYGIENPDLAEQRLAEAYYDTAYAYDCWVFNNRPDDWERVRGLLDSCQNRRLYFEARKLARTWAPEQVPLGILEARL